MHIPEKKWKELWKLKPVVATDCVVVDKKRILLIKRATPPFKGFWCLPGGFVEVGETTEQTAMREVLEETGVKAKIISLIGVYSGPKRDPRGTTVTICYLMKIVTSGGKTDGEASDVKFFPLDALPRLGFDHGQIIKDALKLLRENKRK